MDYALTRPDVDGDNLVLIGMSLGGYLAARAVAFEHRFKAAVFFDGVYDLYESMRKLFPAEAIAAYDAGDRDVCQRIVEEKMQTNTPLKWNMNQGTWSFAVPDAAGILDTSRQYTLRDIVKQIKCACLVMEAESDIFFTGQPERVYDELEAPKTLVRFTAEDGAENHCQSGALSYKDEVVFNWIDATLKL
ncbi:alpha/beta hydrolase family protein [Methylobacterium nonmethylotrophicum]|uniref:alpha/beta hydrolase family protein n=1 Tax=Methylobacterium nonmethylotrophicum TaxID=1141884 RepID=UPI0014368B83|nr:prolyl oligopeptidase family serine peptidase [Methylobacterium nonmethylotrophicum]